MREKKTGKVSNIYEQKTILRKCQRNSLEMFSVKPKNNRESYSPIEPYVGAYLNSTLWERGNILWIIPKLDSFQPEIIILGAFNSSSTDKKPDGLVKFEEVWFFPNTESRVSIINTWHTG